MTLYALSNLNMFNFVEPTELCASWTSSCHTEKQPVILPNQLLKHLKTHDVMGLDHLYQSFYRQFKGAILNEEDGFNMQLQVSAFLNGMFSKAVQKFLVLVLCPDELILNWHYHLTIHGDLQVQIITPKTCPEDFDQEHGLVLLLPFTNIKLADALLGYGFFSIVVDHIDEVATKLIIRKLHGDFNIGLTRRNFYDCPQQKLQWTMLNWSNPGSVGKLDEFYQNDNDNFANTRDNYYHWWFTLTWKFCDNFQRPTEKEIEDYSETLSKWAGDNDILKTKKCRIKRDKPVYKAEKNVEIFSKNIKDIDETEDDICDEFRKNLKKEVENPCISNSSSETIIYEPTLTELEEKNKSENWVKSIEEDDDIIMSIIGDTDELTHVEDDDPESKVSQKKEELMTEIFDDFSSVSENVMQAEEDNDSSDFLLSLL